jgi:hypothetical protein
MYRSAYGLSNIGLNGLLKARYDGPMLPKPLILSFVVLVLLGLSALVAFFLIRPEAEVPLPTPPTATSTQPATLEDTGQYYDITATYPSAVALDASASVSAQATAKAVLDAWVKETVATFKANSGLETLTEEDVRIQGLGEGRKYALDIDYKTFTDRKCTKTRLARTRTRSTAHSPLTPFLAKSCASRTSSRAPGT